MSKADSEKPLCAPLLEALQAMERWLERDGMDRFMVAAATLNEFKRQPLPAHLRITIKKRKSKRVASKGRRYYRNSALISARWPEDGQDANVVPTLVFVLRGQMDMHIADYVLHCQPGDIIFFPPGVPKSDGSRPHYEAPFENQACDLFWMCPWMTNNDGMECWICHSRGAEHLVGQDNEVCWVRHDLLIQLFHTLNEELQSSSESKTAYHLLYCMLLQAQREIEQERIFLPGHKNALSTDTNVSHDPIEQACAYIKSHLNQSLTLDRLARQVCLSPTSLTRKFRHQTTKSVTEYINDIRLEEAASLLQDTEWSINMVGHFVGLKPPRMRQLFQQIHGCSPTEFRQRKIGRKLSKDA